MDRDRSPGSQPPPPWAGAASSTRKGSTRKRTIRSGAELVVLLRPTVLMLVAAAVLLSGVTTAAAAAAACKPEVLANCPMTGLIAYREFSQAFPVIEYCLDPDRGFVPVESRAACEEFGLGKWTVRPGECVCPPAEIGDRGASSSTQHHLTQPQPKQHTNRAQGGPPPGTSRSKIGTPAPSAPLTAARWPRGRRRSGS